MDEKTGKSAVGLEHLVHDAKRCIGLAFRYDTKLIAAAKAAGARWSASHKRWYTPNTPEHLRAIFQKTGVTRQAMLVRLLLNSVMAVG